MEEAGNSFQGYRFFCQACKATDKLCMVVSGGVLKMPSIDKVVGEKFSTAAGNKGIEGISCCFLPPPNQKME
jgi:hypothetical protein